MTFLGSNKPLWLHNRVCLFYFLPTIYLLWVALSGYVDPYNLYRSNYTFINESDTLFCVLPVDVNYYLHTMGIAKQQWNMGVFEQDWMAAVLMNMHVFFFYFLSSSSSHFLFSS